MPKMGWICDASRHDALGEARTAERAGVDLLVLLQGGRDDPWALVEAIADATRALGVVLVTSAPVVGDALAVAAAAARAARRAPGRIELALEVGSADHDGRPLLNWERMSRMRLILPALRDLLAGRAVHLATPHLALDGMLDEPPPEPPVMWMVADGPSSAAMAASLADGAIVEASDAVRHDVLGPFRQGAPDAPVMVLVRAASIREAVSAASGLRPDVLAVRVEGDVGAAMRALAS